MPGWRWGLGAVGGQPGRVDCETWRVGLLELPLTRLSAPVCFVCANLPHLSSPPCREVVWYDDSDFLEERLDGTPLNLVRA